MNKDQMQESIDSSILSKTQVEEFLHKTYEELLDQTIFDKIPNLSSVQKDLNKFFKDHYQYYLPNKDEEILEVLLKWETNLYEILLASDQDISHYLRIMENCSNINIFLGVIRLLHRKLHNFEAGDWKNLGFILEPFIQLILNHTEDVKSSLFTTRVDESVTIKEEILEEFRL